jgi:hypothetical protein
MTKLWALVLAASAIGSSASVARADPKDPAVVVAEHSISQPGVTGSISRELVTGRTRESRLGVTGTNASGDEIQIRTSSAHANGKQTRRFFMMETKRANGTTSTRVYVSSPGSRSLEVKDVKRDTSDGELKRIAERRYNDNGAGRFMTRTYRVMGPNGKVSDYKFERVNQPGHPIETSRSVHASRTLAQRSR